MNIKIFTMAKIQNNNNRYIHNMFKKKQNSGVGSVKVLEVGMNNKWRIILR